MRTHRASFLSLLVALLGLPCLPAAGQDFSSEISLGFGYLGGKVDEPLVAVDGVPSPSYAYREDSSGRSLQVAATRFSGGVPDDGATPLALLPFVARRSSLGASVGLSGRSRDSYGIARGQAVTIESRLSGDASALAGALDGAWFFRPGLALHATLATESFRETQAWSSVQAPGDLYFAGTTAPKRDRLAGSLGVLARPTPELSLEAALLGATVTEKSDERAAFAPGPGAGGPPLNGTRSDADTLGVALSARLLLARRRVALDAGASYGGTHGDSGYTQPVARTFARSHERARAVSGAVTWFPSRVAGVTAGAAYGTAQTAQGLAEERPVASRRTVTWRAAARWFFRAAASPASPASLAVDVSRTTTDTVTPPEGASFQRYRATDDRVTLTATLRF